MSRLVKAPQNIVKITVSQHAHGFTTGQIIQQDTDGLWRLADGSDGTELGIGLVNVTGGSIRFEVISSGLFRLPSHNFPVSDYLYLSDIANGALSVVEPTDTASFSQPIAYVIDADTILVIPYRPSVSTGIFDGSEFNALRDTGDVRNGFVNAHFDNAQRGAAFVNPASDTVTLDRWKVFKVATPGTIDVNHVTTPTSINSRGELEIDTTATGTASGTTSFSIRQAMQDIELYLGKTISISVLVESKISTSQRFGIRVRTGVGDLLTDTLLAGNASAVVEFASVAIPLNATILEIDFHTAGNTGQGFSTNFITTNTGSINLSQVQLNVGSVVLPFSSLTRADDLAQCQRWFEKSYDRGVAPGTALGAGGAAAGLVVQAISPNDRFSGWVSFKATKSAAPTIVIYDHLGASGNLSVGTVAAGWAAGGGQAAAAGGVGDSGFTPSRNADLSANGIVAYAWTAEVDVD